MAQKHLLNKKPDKSFDASGAHKRARTTGVVLVGFGEPQDCSKRAIRKFGKSVLLDKNTSKGNRLLWWLKVRFRMLRNVTKENVQAFQNLWPQGNFPEQEALNALCDPLSKLLSNKKKVTVCAATLFGNNSICNAFAQLKELNCNKVIVFPLFPQSSFSIAQTLASKLKNAKKRTRFDCSFSVVTNYHSNETYTHALAAAIEHAGFNEQAGDKLLLAYRSIPLFDIEQGDTYELQTGATSLAIASELNLSRNSWTMAYFATPFDSREHLDPYVRDVVERWARYCTGRMFIVCPGFANESIRTQFYVNKVLRHKFETIRFQTKGQGEARALKGAAHALAAAPEFVYVPALGKTRAHLTVLTRVLMPYIAEEKEQ